MSYVLEYTTEASEQFLNLERRDVAKHRKVVKCLRLLSEDPKYPSLHSHQYASKSGPKGEEVWESYVENNTPSAWRVFWYFSPDTAIEKVITVLAITPHP